MTTSLNREAFDFFHAHAGYVVGERAIGAASLARAESLLNRAIDCGVATVQWLDDDEPYDQGDSCSDDEARAKFESNEWTGPFGCVVWVGANLEADGLRIRHGRPDGLGHKRKPVGDRRRAGEHP